MVSPIQDLSRTPPSWWTRLARVRSSHRPGTHELTSGIVLLALSCGLAFRAQYFLTPEKRVEAGVLLYVVAATLAVVGAAMIDRRVPPRNEGSTWTAEGRSEPPDIDQRAETSRRTVAVLCAASGLLLIVFSVFLIEARQAYGTTFWLWLAGLVVLAGGWAVYSPGGWQVRLPYPRRGHWYEMALLLVIFVVTVALRFPGLAEVPANVHGDEAAVGLEARRILRGEVPNLFGAGWYDIPYLSFAIPVPFMRLFGDNLYGLRLASATQGALSVALFYLVVKRLFSTRVALIAAFLLAVSQFDVHFSRIGTIYMQAEFAQLLLFYLVLRAVETRRGVNYLLAGYAVGLCLIVYQAARLAPLLIGLYIVHLAITKPGFCRRQWRGLLPMALGACAFLAPLAAYYVHNWHTFLSRTRGVLIFSPANFEHAVGSLQDKTWSGVLQAQVFNTVGAFNYLGETSLQYGQRGPLLDYWTGALFVLGVAIVTTRPHRPNYFLVGIWLWLTLLAGSVLTVDALFSPHIIAVAPVLCLFPALVLDSGWRGVEASWRRVGSRIFAAGVILFFALAARDNYVGYFQTYDTRTMPPGFFTLLSAYVAQINDRYRVYLIGGRDTSILYDTPHFLLPELDAVDVRDAPLSLPLDRLPRTKGVAFIAEAAFPKAEERLAALRAAYPDGVESLHRTSLGVPTFYTYLVDHNSLAAARPDAMVDDARIPGTLLARLESPSHSQPPSSAGRQAPSLDLRPLLWLRGFQEPRHLAVSPSGDIYVVDRKSATVWRFDANGQVLGRIPSGVDSTPTLTDPRAVAVGGDDAIAVLDAATNQVLIFTPDGALRSSIRLAGAYSPGGLTADSRGRLYVADTGQNRVLRVESGGDTTAVIGAAANEQARLNQPTDVAFGPGGEIYVVDVGKRRIAVFGADFVYRREWPLPPADTAHAPHLVVTPGGVLVSDPDGGGIVQYDFAGREIGRLMGGELVRPVGLAADEEWAIYITDVGTRAVIKYGPGQAP